MKERNNILVIWDLDGTLLDTSLGLLESAKFLINKYGLDMPDDETFKSFAGPRIQDSLKRFYDLDDETIKRLSDVYRDDYKNNNLLNAKLYEGVMDVLEVLSSKGIMQAVATNKRQDLAELILNEFGISGYMDAICGTDFGGKFTKADLLNHCMETCGVSRDDTLLVGDSDYDAKAAAEVGVDFAAVMYGLGFREERDIQGLPYKIMINEPKDIINIFRSKKLWH